MRSLRITGVGQPTRASLGPGISSKYCLNYPLGVSGASDATMAVNIVPDWVPIPN